MQEYSKMGSLTLDKVRDNIWAKSITTVDEMQTCMDFALIAGEHMRDFIP